MRVLVALALVLVISTHAVSARFQVNGVTHPGKQGVFAGKLSLNKRRVAVVEGDFSAVSALGTSVFVTQGTTAGSSFVDSNGETIVSQPSRRFVASVDSASGRAKWNATTFPGPALQQENIELAGPVLSHPDSAKDVLIVSDENVYGLDVKTGAFLWWHGDVGCGDAVALPNGTFAMGCSNRSLLSQEVLVVRGDSGEVQARLRNDSVYFVRVAAANATLVVAFGIVQGEKPEGVLIVWNTATGGWRSTDLPGTGEGVASFVAVERNTAVVSTVAGEGTSRKDAIDVWAVDVQSGGVLWRYGSENTQRQRAPHIVVRPTQVFVRTRLELPTLPGGSQTNITVLSLVNGQELATRILSSGTANSDVDGFFFSTTQNALITGVSSYDVAATGVLSEGSRAGFTSAHMRGLAVDDQSSFAILELQTARIDSTKTVHRFTLNIYGCGEHFLDAVCAECAPGYFLTSQSCQECPAFSPVAIVVLIGLLFAATVVWSVWKPPKGGTGPEASHNIELSVHGRDEGDGKNSTSREVGVPQLTRLMPFVQFVHFAQVVSLSARVAAPGFWPPVALAVVDILQYLNLDVERVGVQCEVALDLLARSWLFVSVQVGVCGLLLGAIAYMRVTGSGTDGQAALLARVLIQLIRFAFLGAAVRGLTVFDCIGEFEGSVMVADPNVVCYTSTKWAEHFVMSMFGLLVLCLLPLCGFYALWQKYRAEGDEDAFVRDAYGFLFVDYRVDAGFFEGVVLLRKALVSVLVLGFETLPTHINFTLFSVLTLLTLVTALGRPYRRRRRNVLECVLTFSSALVFLLAAVDNMDVAGAGDTPGLIALVVVLATIPATVVVAVQDWKEERSIGSMSAAEVEALEEDDQLGVTPGGWGDRATLARWAVATAVVHWNGWIVGLVALVLRFNGGSEGVLRALQSTSTLTWITPVFMGFLLFVKELEEEEEEHPHSKALGAYFGIHFSAGGIAMVNFYVTDVDPATLIAFFCVSSMAQTVWWQLAWRRWRSH